LDKPLASGFGANDVERTVIVTVGAARMMEPPPDEMVDVAAMRNRLMPAAGPMDKAGFVTFVGEPRRAPVRDSGAYFSHRLFDIVPILIQMSSRLSCSQDISAPARHR
jgi:hypothetical protein